MSVLRITHFKGGNPTEMAAIAKDAKKVWEALGANFVSYRRYEAGPMMGETLFIVRFPDWASLGKALDRRGSDSIYQATLQRALSISEVVSVDYLSEIDL